jgi:hypothetical protein
MKLSRLLPVVGLMLLGLVSARSANATTIRLNDPTCPAGDFCVDIDWTGATTTFSSAANEYLNFAVPVPPGAYPENPANSFVCESNTFSFDEASTSQVPGGLQLFTGCLFSDGTLSGGETLTLSSDAPIALDLPNGFNCDADDAAGTCGGGVADLSAMPEPSSIVLTFAGLALSMVGFAIFDPRRKAATASLQA